MRAKIQTIRYLITKNYFSYTCYSSTSLYTKFQTRRSKTRRQSKIKPSSSSSSSIQKRGSRVEKVGEEEEDEEEFSEDEEEVTKLKVLEYSI